MKNCLKNKLSKIKISNNWHWVVIGIVIILSCLPLFKAGYYKIHDQEHIVRLYEFDQALKSGQIPPRWGANLGYGYGYPIFVFYPPLIYVISEIFYLIGFSLITSVKLMLFSGTVIGGISMYFLAKKFVNKFGATVAAIAFLLTPYRAVNLYVRGAFAEYFAYCLLPIVFLSFYNLLNISFERKLEKISSALFAGISLGLLVLAHSLVALPFIPIFIIYILYLLLIQKRRLFGTKKKLLNKIWQLILSGLTAIGLSAFFWMPSLFEKKYTMVDLNLTTDLANYKQHFVYLRQFVFDQWGYGGSIFGLEDGLSFSLGWVYILAIIVSSLILLVKIFKSRKIIDKHVLVYLIILIFSIFMSSFHSQFIWDILKNYLAYLQFPWRYLTFAAFASSMLVGYSVASILKIKKITGYILGFIAIIVMLIPVFNTYKPKEYLKVGDAYFINEEMMKWEISKKSDEYIPRGVNQEVEKEYPPEIANKSKITKKMVSKKRFEIVSGTASVQIISSRPGNEEFLIKASKSGKIRVHTFNFPGWEAYLDNNRVQIMNNNPLKLITVAFPNGETRLKLMFEKTLVRQMGDIISLATALSVLIFYGYKKYG